jgi:hypothetical protein
MPTLTALHASKHCTFHEQFRMVKHVVVSVFWAVWMKYLYSAFFGGGGPHKPNLTLASNSSIDWWVNWYWCNHFTHRHFHSRNCKYICSTRVPKALIIGCGMSRYTELHYTDDCHSSIELICQVVIALLYYLTAVHHHSVIPSKPMAVDAYVTFYHIDDEPTGRCREPWIHTIAFGGPFASFTSWNHCKYIVGKCCTGLAILYII